MMNICGADTATVADHGVPASWTVGITSTLLPSLRFLFHSYFIFLP